MCESIKRSVSFSYKCPSFFFINNRFFNVTIYFKIPNRQISTYLIFVFTPIIIENVIHPLQKYYLDYPYPYNVPRYGRQVTSQRRASAAVNYSNVIKSCTLRYAGAQTFLKSNNKNRDLERVILWSKFQNIFMSIRNF